MTCTEEENDWKYINQRSESWVSNEANIKILFSFQVKSFGFQDSWHLGGCPKPIKTCRFDTHIDYVYANEKLLSNYRVQEVLHVDDRASDHNLVKVIFALKDWNIFQLLQHYFDCQIIVKHENYVITDYLKIIWKLEISNKETQFFFQRLDFHSLDFFINNKLKRIAKYYQIP